MNVKKQLPPTTMLEAYRDQLKRQGQTEVIAQAEMFKKMPIDDQLELLFYMAASCGMSIGYLMEQVSPETFEANGFKSFGSPQ